MSLNIFHLKVAFFIFHENDLRPILKVSFIMIFIQQIISIFVIDFDKGNIEEIVILILFSFEPLKNIAKNSGYYTPICPFFPSTHSESLAAASLPIGKNGSIVSLKTVINDRFGDNLKNLCLINRFRENLFVIELMMIFCIGHFIP